MNKIKYKKKTIPKAIREQCWVNIMGKTFENKCYRRTDLCSMCYCVNNIK